jgi:hypothetical protein
MNHPKKTLWLSGIHIALAGIQLQIAPGIFLRGAPKSTHQSSRLHHRPAVIYMFST